MDDLIEHINQFLDIKEVKEISGLWNTLTACKAALSSQWVSVAPKTREQARQEFEQLFPPREGYTYNEVMNTYYFCNDWESRQREKTLWLYCENWKTYQSIHLPPIEQEQADG